MGTAMTIGDISRCANRLGFRKSWIVSILVLNLGSVVFEGLGVGIFLPILQYMNNNGDITKLTADSRLWRVLAEVFNTMHLPLTFAALLITAFLFLLVRQAFLFARLLLVGTVQFEFIRRTRDVAFQRFLSADLAYHDKVRSGRIVNEMTTELARAVGAFMSIISFLGYILMGGVYLVILILLSPGMTAVAFTIIGLAALSLIKIHRKTRTAGIDQTAANQRMSAFLVERLRAVRLIRLSGMERPEIEAMAALNQRQKDVSVRIVTLKAQLSVLIEPIVILIGLILLYVAQATLALNFAAILLFFLVLMRMLPIVKEILVTWQNFLALTPAVTEVDRRLMDMARAEDVDHGRRAFAPPRRSIAFRAVVYSYHADRAPALNGVSVTLPAASMVAIVGPSGAGKSTFVDMIPRLRRPDAGEISIDGTPLDGFALASLRAGISVAMQTPQFFDVTVAAFIRYGKPDASMAEVARAAALAGAADFIDALPEKYETTLGEDGVGVSGGQRQRLDLARALVRQAPILILDEPTSNLDAESEHRFRDSLARIHRETDMTIIVIAHRLSTVSIADRIIVLEDGRVTATGTHDELAAAGGWYAQALAHQHHGRLDDGTMKQQAVS